MKILQYTDFGDRKDGGKFHFSLAIASGTIAAVIIKSFGMWGHKHGKTEHSYRRMRCELCKGLLEYINSNHFSSFMAAVYKADSFAAYFEKQPPVDILIISPDFYDISVEGLKSSLRYTIRRSFET